MPVDRRRTPETLSMAVATLRSMDRIARVATKRSLDEPDDSWTRYWASRPISERLQMATELSAECVISSDDLVANKRATGRPQDLVDVEILEQLDQLGREAGAGRLSHTERSQSETTTKEALDEDRGD